MILFTTQLWTMNVWGFFAQLYLDNPPREGDMRKGGLVEMWVVRINFNWNLINCGLPNDVLNIFRTKFHHNAIMCNFETLTQQVKFDRIHDLWPKNIMFVQICYQMLTNLVIFGRLQPFGIVFVHFWEKQNCENFHKLPIPTLLGPPGFYNVNHEGTNAKFLGGGSRAPPLKKILGPPPNPKNRIIVRSAGPKEFRN